LIKDNDLQALVELICNYSLNLSIGDRITLEFVDIEYTYINKVVEVFNDRGILTFVSIKNSYSMTKSFSNYCAEDYNILATNELNYLKNSKAIVGFRCIDYMYESKMLSNDQLRQLLFNFLQPVHYTYRNNNIKWLYFRLPSISMAHNAKLPFDEFYQKYMNSVFCDYNKLRSNSDILKDRLLKTNNVRITNDNKTNIEFSIKEIGVYSSIGTHNLPDGEVHTAPVLESVNGEICFNVPSTYYGHHFNEVYLKYSKGKLIDYYAQSSYKDLEYLIQIDDGASKFGEFAFGINSKVDKPLNDILYDEKMFGSVHFALGNAYNVSNNNNISSIHWDLILDLNTKAGGGKVYFDDALVMNDGKFIGVELEQINL